MTAARGPDGSSVAGVSAGAPGMVLAAQRPGPGGPDGLRRPGPHPRALRRRPSPAALRAPVQRPDLRRPGHRPMVDQGRLGGGMLADAWRIVLAPVAEPRRHGGVPLTSMSIEKLRKVLIRTMSPRVSTLFRVGATAIVLTRSAATRISKPRSKVPPRA